MNNRPVTRSVTSAIPTLLGEAPTPVLGDLLEVDQPQVDSSLQGEEGSDQDSSQEFYDPWQRDVDAQLGFNPRFTFYLRTMKARSVTARLMAQVGVNCEEILFNLTESELETRLHYSWIELVTYRSARSLWRSATKPVPAGLLSLLPRFRGTGEKGITDPHSFIDQIENILSASSYPIPNWATIVTICLTTPEDMAYWRAHMDRNPMFTWDEHRRIFLQHFGHFDQRKKYVDELTRVSQGTSESAQTYIDRVAELSRKAGRPLDDEMVIFYLKKGIRSVDLKRFIAMKEEPGVNWTFGRLSQIMLMAADHLQGASSSSHPETSSGTAYCRHCRRAGHTQANCRVMQRTLQSGKESTGGEKRVLFESPKRTGKEPMKLRNPCSKCPNADHIFSNCPKNTCSVCDKTGHLNFNCPMAICNACKQKGHTALSFDCPKNPKYKDNKHIGKYVTDITTEIKWHTYSKKAEWLAVETEDFIVAATSASTETNHSGIEAPLTIKGHRVMAPIDTKATHSIMSTSLCHELGERKKTEEVDIRARTAFQGLPKISLRQTRPLLVSCGTKSVEHRFYVADMTENMLLGMDLFGAFGFGLVGVPIRFANDEAQSIQSTSSADAVGEDRQLTYESLKRLPQEEVEILMHALEQILLQNESISDKDFCRHPEAVLPIPLSNYQPIYRPQFEIPKRLHEVVDEQVGKWLENGKIEEGSPLTRWNASLLLAPKRDLYGERTEWRVCFDGRAINERLEPRFPTSERVISPCGWVSVLYCT